MWTSIADVQPVILAFAGPLTQYLNGALDAELHLYDTNRERTVARIWADAFSMDWRGHLERLPPTMYSNVMAYVSTNCWSLIDRNQYCNKNFALPTYAGWTLDIELCDTDAAPMENVWLDVLAPFLDFPIALAHAAVIGGHLELLRYLIREKGIVVADFGYIHEYGRSGPAMDVAASYGHLEVLKLLHDRGAPLCTTAAMDKAAVNGHFHVVQWLQQHRTEGCSPNILDQVIMNGHKDIVLFLQKHYIATFSPAVFQAAATYNDVDLVQELHFVWHAPCTAAVMDTAAAHSSVAIVEFLHRNRTEGCTVRAMDSAAFRGAVDVVRFLHNNRDEGCTTLALDAAARCGHLPVVQFLTEHRTEGGTVHAMDRAAHRGFEAVVRYLHKHRDEGCTTRAVDWAAAAGHLSIVRFLLKHRSEGGTFRGIYWAAWHEHRDYPAIVALLLQHDTTKAHAAAAVERALRIGDRRTFDALLAAGCDGSIDVNVDAIDWRPPSRADVLHDDPATGEYGYADKDEDEEYFRFDMY
ncbi:hypothetical protein SPRG_13229 [Saprolegnia parasitica CBS 223.65]|uniref:Uncharacterized protein n=1 Tax=Saprolegnia parasitica (strain CBS 223.65) TaxID=695850 RepID=A0A067C1T7_SAPPC|nr:hypothetical protein SPRG_13229 [Saprolegnia parasitica CBS 223.65]KDO20531.1 hypothetical protein SPRG_13229 [Saprolegnia parasitica CBS 223.65]|eukprot:XP_012208727.1 hypothetical protein SPRG_13229 [Saprolegnia parasitica CBS 223.65]